MDKPNISWLGTGVMGVPMATHLLQAGYEMRVFSRTRAKAEKLLEMGRNVADSPQRQRKQAKWSSPCSDIPKRRRRFLEKMVYEMHSEKEGLWWI